MQAARQLIEGDAGPSAHDDLTTLAYVINYNFSYDYQLTADHVWAIRQNPEVLLTPAAKRKVNPLIVDLMVDSASAGAYEWVSQIKDVITAGILLHQYKVYSTTGAFGIDQKRRVIDTASKFGFGPHLDQKAYRTAMAAVLSKEESLAGETSEPDAAETARMATAKKILDHVDENYTLAPWCAALLKKDPSLLALSPFGDTWPLLLFLLNGLPPAQMRKLDGLITPEMLLAPSNSQAGKKRTPWPAGQTVLDVVITREYADKINPDTYRKALAMKLRKEESLDLNKRLAGPPFASDEAAAAWVIHSFLTHKRVTPAVLEFIRDNPRVLSVRPNGFYWTLLGELIWAGHVDGDAGDVKHLLGSIRDLITPEMLAKPSGTLNRASALDAVNRTGAQALIDPQVYRKAMAMKHRQEESLTEAAWHHPAWKNRIMRLSELAYTGDPMTADDVKMVKDNPGVLTSAEPGFGVMLTFIAHRAQSLRGHSDNRPTLLQHLTDHNLITADMLMMPALVLRAPDKSPTILDVITDEGAAHMLDPKIVRQATAMKLSKSESLARRVISQLI